MGARWNWDVVCDNGHIYGNYSGGADDCYKCGAPPEVEFQGDDSRQQAEEYLRQRSSQLAITRTLDQISRPDAGGLCQCQCREGAQINSSQSVRLTVDQPPSAVGVRFPPCPPSTKNTEQNDEEGDPEIAGGGGQAAFPLVRSITLEERLFVALSRRGPRRIGQMLAEALDLCDGHSGHPGHPCIWGIPDDHLLAACEQYIDLIERAAS